MAKIDVAEQTHFNGLTIQVETPEGRMFVMIIEDNDGKPIAIDLKVGKAGAPLQAWAIAFARIMTISLDHGVTLEELITELSQQKSDRSKVGAHGVTISSGPDGVCYALMQYRKDKFEQTRKILGIDDDDDADRMGRGPRMSR